MSKTELIVGKPHCQLCGEPMPPGEEMFNYHGYSGDCPKPPLPKPELKALVEYYLGDSKDGQFYLNIHVDNKPYHQIGFDTPEERQRALDDLLNMQRSAGAIDIPNQEQ
jgi:hypothetical protein